MNTPRTAPRWIAPALALAAASDILVGALMVVAPTAPLSWLGLPLPRYPEAWQCAGLLLGLYGLNYAFAARHPLRLWPLVLVGLLGKLLVPAGYLWAASSGLSPWELAPLVLALGPIWWVPFGLILREVARAHRAEQTPPNLPLDLALSLYRDGEGADLLERSMDQPQFLVFLRHFGCTFCREALADLAAINERLQTLGTRLVLVHMSTEADAREVLARYGLQEAAAISDPDRVLYRAFALRRGTPTQLYGWSVLKRGWEAGVKQGHGIGWLRGDAAQMPGAFVVSRGHVVAQFIHETAADRPDYVGVANEGVDQTAFQEGLEKEDVGFGFQARLRQALAAGAKESA